MEKTFKKFLQFSIIFLFALVCPIGSGVRAEIDPAMPPKGPGIEIGDRAVHISKSEGTKTYIFKDPVPITITWQGNEELAGSFQVISRVDGKSRESIVDREDMSGPRNRLSYTFLLDKKYAGKAFGLKVRAISRYGVKGPWSSLDGNYLLDLESPTIKLNKETGSDKSYEIEFLIEDDNLDRDRLDLLVSARDGRGKKLSIGYDKSFSRPGDKVYKLILNFREPASYIVKVRAYDLTGRESGVFKKAFIFGNQGPAEEIVEEAIVEEDPVGPSHKSQIKEADGPKSKEQESQGREGHEASQVQSSKDESDKPDPGGKKDDIKPIYLNNLKISFSGAFKRLLAGETITFRRIGQDFVVRAYSQDLIDKENFKFIAFRNGLAIRPKVSCLLTKDGPGYTYTLTLRKEEFLGPGFYDLAFYYDAIKSDDSFAVDANKKDDRTIKFTFKVEPKRPGGHVFTIVILLTIFIILIYEKVKYFILF